MGPNSVEVSRPESVKLYSSNMRGVDKVDFLPSMYRSYRRSKKWTIRMMTHTVDLAVVNSWLEYKKDAASAGMRSKQILDLWEFRQLIAENFISSKKTPKSGRPRMTDEGTSKKKAKYGTKLIGELRYDKYDRFPEVDGKPDAARCKLELCKGKTRVYCIKCGVHLCLSENRNCCVALHDK
ncbi:hypothetical protein JTB14_009624 [Gonioctena quinquepunctata]|nr:hypothetical protein JTB14_009624 [Gonioctena quinquepunctata]